MCVTISLSQQPLPNESWLLYYARRVGLVYVYNTQKTKCMSGGLGRYQYTISGIGALCRFTA